jgi:hypothetical protein
MIETTSCAAICFGVVLDCQTMLYFVLDKGTEKVLLYLFDILFFPTPAYIPCAWAYASRNK